MFLHGVNNIKHDIKQHIYTGMEVISLIAQRYCIYKNSKNEDVVINNKKYKKLINKYALNNIVILC